MARADPHERGARTPGPGSHTARCAVSADESRARGQPPASLGARERAERSADDERRVRGRRSLSCVLLGLAMGGAGCRRGSSIGGTRRQGVLSHSAVFFLSLQSEANSNFWRLRCVDTKASTHPAPRGQGQGNDLGSGGGGRSTGRRRAPAAPGRGVTGSKGEVFKNFTTKLSLYNTS